MKAKSVVNNYRFLIILLLAMILGAVTGAVLPHFAHSISFLGTIFIRMMFCIVVPMVFASISSAMANIKSRKRAGKIMGVTVLTFVLTGAAAAIVYFLLCQIFPPVTSPWASMAKEKVGEHATMTEMIMNFFTVEDFSMLLSRKAMLPLIIFSLLFGFSVNLAGEEGKKVAAFLDSLTTVMMKFVQVVTYYAPIAFFAIFADLVSTYGSQITESYARALLLYYPVCFIYIFTAFPLMAFIGAGREGIKVMFSHIVKPAIVSLGTCSSVATIPSNMEAAAESGISKDVSDIVIPLGATMHMDGSCFSCVLKIVFVMGALGTPVKFSDLPAIVLVAVLSAVGMSGVPGGGYIGEYIIASIFFPNNMELAFPILVAIGNLIDPPATMINAAGDYVVSFIVSRFVDGKDWLKKRNGEEKGHRW
ncbi:MAG: dicarboxylate/amino acid:cation symporter [Oribacterium parvum]|uniref:Dicarboxylate/amino acid:cation symporter n=1 Tax=Oribacterium parvum TaxID=1501329 RepID=A0A930DLT2_9FIRM|nr:dicarboxylate/amino acid:cation symporter [Oribacterium parvum]